MMKKQPIIETKRLLLRSFELADAPQVQRLAGEREVAATTMNIPHPYEDGMAEAWIATHRESFELGRRAIFAIVLRETASLTGCINLRLNLNHQRAELGYWIGKPYWNKGYGSEAAQALLKYGFETLRLNRIFAHHMSSNPASGKIMQKIGMKREGFLSQHVKKSGVYEDLELYAILRSDYEALKTSSSE